MTDTPIPEGGSFLARRGKAGSVMTILVLDHHESTRNHMVGILSRNGHAARGVATVKDALAMLEGAEYDFVIADHRLLAGGGWLLPGTSGQSSRTRLILSTTSPCGSILETMETTGAAGYMVKPLVAEDLLWNLEFHADSGDDARSAGAGSRRGGKS